MRDTTARTLQRVVARLALAALVGLTALAGLPPTQAGTPNRAGLAVQFGDGVVITRCIEFDTTQVTGYDLIARSGLAFTVAGEPDTGATLCKIEQQGCPATDCFCAFPPNYWSYWQLNDNDEWRFSPVGMSARNLGHGDVDGWIWGNGSVALPSISFAEICEPAAAEPPYALYLPVILGGSEESD